MNMTSHVHYCIPVVLHTICDVTAEHTVQAHCGKPDQAEVNEPNTPLLD